MLHDTFSTIFTVAESRSLLEGARRLAPSLIIVDIGVSEHGMLPLLQQLDAEVPDARIVVLSLSDDPAVAHAAMAGGADGVVLKRRIAEDLLPAIDTILAGGTFQSAQFSAEP